MGRDSLKQRPLRTTPGFRLPARPGLEGLEERLMMAADDLDPITVGRSLSSWAVADVSNNQLRITYTVYNQDPDPIGGVLLATTLAPGVSFLGASSGADRDGQELAFSLGTIGGYGRASVEVTVALAGAGVLQIDGGARAFATLDARAIGDTAPAAFLRTGAAPAGTLAATPDADSGDPFIQEKAAELDYDPQRIFAFLRDDVGYESYVGSLRGARGTLWSGAGNALDEASLGVALMRASGIPARYARGIISDELSRQLILSMFPTPIQTIGFIEPGAATADPANDPKLLAEARDHYWYEYDVGSGFIDADASIEGLQLGQIATSRAGTFVEVDDSLRHKVTVRLDAEITSQIGQLFGFGGPPAQTTVLSHTFLSAALAGRPLTVGQFVSPGGTAALALSMQTFTYSPYIAQGDLAFPDGRNDELIQGTSFQEVLTNFPLASQFLTGLVLRMELTGPGVPAEGYERYLVDRFGFAARNGGSGGTSFAPGGNPALTDLDLTTIFASPGEIDPDAIRPLADRLEAERQALEALRNPDGSFPEGSISRLIAYQSGVTRLLGAQHLALSDPTTEEMADFALVRAYADRPRLLLSSARVVQGDGNAPSSSTFAIDLRRNTLRVVAAPGQDRKVAAAFLLARGLLENSIERQVVGSFAGANGSNRPVANALTVFEAARARGIGLVALDADNASQLDLMAIPAEARARIAASLAAGFAVIAPVRTAIVDGVELYGWYQLDPATGESIGVTTDGGHSGIVEFTFRQGLVAGVSIRLLASLVTLGGPLGSDPKTAITIFGATGGVTAGLFLLGPMGAIGFTIGVIAGHLIESLIGAVINRDPPIGPFLIGLDTIGDGPSAASSSDVTVAAGPAAGAVAGSVRPEHLAVRGPLDLSWSGATATAMTIAQLHAQGATVRDSQGNLIGSGAVTLGNLSPSNPLPIVVSGPAQYRLAGRGALSFYPAATGGLGTGVDWEVFSAHLAGQPTIELTTSELTLNGVKLPAGSYRIGGAAIDLQGQGTTASPDFAGSAQITASGASLLLGPGAGSVTVGGLPLRLDAGAALDGYSGTLTIAAGGATDLVTLAGTAAHRLTLQAGAPSIAVGANSSAGFDVNILTSLAGAFTLKAQAPEGWDVEVSPAGRVTATPPPGASGTTATIWITARSKARPELVASEEVLVAVDPAQPGLSVDIIHDPLFTVPSNGAQVPTAFQAAIRNLGPDAETIDLTFPTLPPGFRLVASRTRITIAPGATAIVGLYFEPTGQVPAPGSQVSFGVTASSLANPSVNASDAATFTIPEIHGVTLAGDSPALNTLPGAPATLTLTLKAVGNVPETIDLQALLPVGLSASGLATPIALAPGESRTIILTLTPGANTPLNSVLNATVRAQFGAAGSPLAQELAIPVRVLVPGAPAIADAANAASQLGRPELAARLNDLSVALTNLVQVPTDPVPKGQALASLDSVIAQLAADPQLATLVAELATSRQALADATTAAAIQAAVTGLGGILDDLGARLTDLASYRFDLSIVNNNQVAQPQAEAVFQLVIQNTGTKAATYRLDALNPPPGVEVTFDTPTITLAPGEIASNLLMRVTPTSTTSLDAAGIVVQATVEGAPGVGRTATASLTARSEFVSVVSVDTDPPFIEPGGIAAVSARVLNAVNRERQVLASFAVKNDAGQTVFTSAPRPVTLGVLTSLATIDLGTLDTAGLARGQYTIAVALTEDGAVVPGGTGEGRLLVGSPVTSTIEVSPGVVPTGTSTVTTTLAVASQSSLAGPLGVVSQADVPGAGGVIRNGDFLYVSGWDGIRVYNIADPANPQLIRTVGTSADILKIRGDRLYALKANGGAGPFVLTIYGLADPANPQAVGTSPGIPYSNAIDMTITDTHAFVSIWSLSFWLGSNDIFSQSGDILALDISDPGNIHLDGVLRNTYGTNNDGNAIIGGVNLSGGESNTWAIALANPTTLLVAGSTAHDSDTQAGSGVVHVIDISDPAHMTIVRSVEIPGTVQALGLTIAGDTAYVVGTSQGWNDFGADLGFLGNLVLATLDISDPRMPAVQSTRQIPRAGRGLGIAAAINDNLFAFPSLGAASDKPTIQLVDASNPLNLIASGTEVPADVTKLYGQGNFVYATSPSGLIIYEVGAPDAIPATVRVDVPRNTGVSIIPGSFNVPPSQIISGPDFDTLVWDVNLAAGSDSLTFTWRSTVTGMQPGESRSVTLGATVGFTASGSPGLVTLPALDVAAEQILGLDPAIRTVRPGEAAEFTLHLSNPTDAPVTYALSLQGISPGWSDLPASIAVPAGSTIARTVRLTSEALAALGDYGFVITASSPAGATGSVSGTLALAGDPVLPDADAHGVAIAVLPSDAVVGPGGRAAYTVRIVNTGSAIEEFDLSAVLPAGLSGSFDSPSVRVAPGASNAREVTLRLEVEVGTAPGGLRFIVRAASAEAADDAEASLTVATSGVVVGLSPQAGAPGGTFLMTVTNLGSIEDTFDLALAGPAAAASSLASTSVTLAPGASRAVPIAVGAIGFAVPGAIELVGMATSRGNPAVVGTASASVAVDVTSGLGAGFAPAAKLIPIPGTASFLLTVENTGNAEDIYTAVIAGISGPIAASLRGLDGLPAQEVAGFRLPGLAKGSLLLDATLLGIGRGAVRVRVVSQSNGAIAAEATATLATPNAVASTTTLSASPASPLAGQPVTFAAVVASVDGASVPTGTVTFAIDGVASVPIGLQVIDGRVVALFTTSLIAGSHAITATYSGDPAHAASASAALPLSVAGAANGPQVIGIRRFGYHRMPTTLVLAFDQALDPATAQDARNYAIAGRGGAIPVLTAVYDEAARTVTLRPAARLNIHSAYRLVVSGTGANGLRNAPGALLDGDRDGQPGGDHVATIGRANLILKRQEPSLPRTQQAMSHARKITAFHKRVGVNEFSNSRVIAMWSGGTYRRR